MATLVREWILNRDDTINGDNLTKLRERVNDKTCEVVLKKYVEENIKFIVLVDVVVNSMKIIHML